LLTAGFLVSLPETIQLIPGCKLFLLFVRPINRCAIPGWINAQYFPTIHNVIVRL
jgi:hypothetical protein